jgi:hypothetical protein
MLGLTLISVSFLPTLAFCTSLAARQDSCSDVDIFLAKGNNEQEPGRQGALADSICAKVSGSCSYESIHFNNAAGDPYCPSIEQGDANGQQQITDHARKCPRSKLVLSGYSQGANVITDLLGGGGGVLFNSCQ